MDDSLGLRLSELVDDMDNVELDNLVVVRTSNRCKTFLRIRRKCSLACNPRTTYVCMPDIDSRTRLHIPRMSPYIPVDI